VRRLAELSIEQQARRPIALPDLVPRRWGVF
jgi:hypothetical protein